MYDHTKLKDMDDIKDGIRGTAVIISITEGERQDFVRLEVAKDWKDFKPEQKCIQIIAETKYEDQNFRMHKTMTLMDTGVVYKKMKMADWKKVYGNYPHVGQQVEVYSQKGRWHFLV